MADLLGIDIGTSAVKVLLCDERGRILAQASQGYPIHSPKAGWNEQDPEDWWRATVRAVRKVLSARPSARSRLAGIGFSGQMHGSVFLDSRGQVIRRALLWNDQRTQAECREIEAASGSRAQLIEWVNNVALTGYTAPKLLWLRRHEPHHFKRLSMLLLPKDYVRYRMTRKFASEVSDASGTLLFDVKNRRWSWELLGALGISEALLPPVLESADVVGPLTAGAARELGLSSGVPVIAGAGDQAAGAVGMGVVRGGIFSATLGTSGVVFAHSDRVVSNERGLLQSFCHAVPGKYCVFGCMLTAGGALEWFRAQVLENRLGFPQILARAEREEAGARGLFFLPYLDGERCPHPDPAARGAWVGLSRVHDLGSMARALIEGVTYGMADQIELMRELGLQISEVRLGGGGAENRFWRQLQADIYGARTVLANTKDAGAYGAMLLAGVGAGVWPSVERACAATIRLKVAAVPRKKLTEFYRQGHSTYRGLYPALQSTFHPV